MAIKKLPATGTRPGGAKTATGLPLGVSAGGSADSAGFPWAGRSFAHHDTAFANDDGASDPVYIAAVAAVRRAAEGYATANASRDQQLIAQSLEDLAAAQSSALKQLQHIRVLVPLLTEAGELGYTPEGKLVEKTQELSIVTVKAPDGRKVMPVFSGTATLQAWDSTARPIPVPLPQVLLAAAQEETELVIIDPATTQSELGIRAPQFQAAATGADYIPPWFDTQIAARAQEILGVLEHIKLVALLPKDPQMRLLNSELELVLGITAGLDQQQLQTVLGQAASRWQQDEVLAGAADSLTLRAVAV